MALERVSWAAGTGDDLHLLPGLKSPQFNKLLNITAGGATVRADQSLPAGITVAWTQSFVLVPRPAPGCNGVAVDPGTGMVTVGALSALDPPPRLLDFLVIATVTDSTTVPTPTSLQAYLRVHIHTSLRRFWLTPSTLTVRVGARGVRFSVLAEFDDGSYGDITNWSPRTVNPTAPGPELLEVRAAATNRAVASWSSNSPALAVDPVTGVLICSHPATNATITLTTSTPPGVANATAVRADGWGTPATVELISGPGFAAMADVPNVLVIGDGFAAAEKPAFDALANKLVADVHANPRLTPYGLVKDGMNFFRVMRESRETGVSDWNAIDRAPHRTGTLADATHANVSVSATQPATVAPVVANVSRFLLNERDTAFGAVFGDRPRAQRFNAMHGVHLSDRRVTDHDLDVFLGALEDGSLPPRKVGAVWMQNGKDSTLIVVLARTSRYGGANNFRASSGKIICTGLGNTKAHVIGSAGTGHDLVPDAIPVVPHLVAQLLIVHELGHSFNIGDEYGSQLGSPPVPIPIPRDSTRDQANAYANLQTRDKLLDLNGNFDPELAKWGTWQRICKAGELTGAPAPMPGGFRLPLKAGHATPFAQGDIVRLRTRPLPRSIQSDQLEVMAPPPAGGAELHVRPLAGFDPAPFAAADADTIVLAPLLDTSGDEVTLIHASVIGHMVTTKNPLNALPAPATGPQRPCPDMNEPVYTVPPGPPAPPKRVFSTPSFNYGPGNAPNPPKESAWITGLWERGHGFDCEIYHPTGACLMNVFTYDVAEVKSFQFCWVCRYALVDAIDPTKHGDMDKDICYRYPK